MKEFACGDVVPNCHQTFAADTDDALLRAVVRHAQTDHGMTIVTDDVVEQVRQKIRTAG